MGKKRHWGAWLTAGAIAGYFVPGFGMLLFVMREDGWPVVLDLNAIGFCLFFTFALYTITGLCIMGMVFGAACGLACAWLPVRLRTWQKRVIFAALVPFTAPAVWYMQPFWPFDFPMS